MNYVDVYLNGALWLRHQSVMNAAMRGRVWERVVNGARVDIRPASSPPPPAPPSAFRPILLTAENPLEGVMVNGGLPWRGRIGLSADRAYREAVLRDLPTLKTYYPGGLFAWGDCEATPAAAIVSMADELHLDGWLGQAESDAQYVNAASRGARELTGDAASLSATHREQITLERITFHQNAYWGDSQGAPSTVSAQGIPARLNVGVYPACRPAADYVRDMPTLAQRGGPLGAIFRAEGGDWTPFATAT